MKDPFGMQHGIVLTSGDKNSVAKKEKKNDVDLVKIYLASVPALEGAKDELENIAQSVRNEAVKSKINGFVQSIITITEDILDLTKMAIRQEKTDESAMPVPQEMQQGSQQVTQQAITPEMINGTMPIN